MIDSDTARRILQLLIIEIFHYIFLVTEIFGSVLSFLVRSNRAFKRSLKVADGTIHIICVYMWGLASLRLLEVL